MAAEVLTAERLRGLEAREAAARFIVRRAEGWSSDEAVLLDAWLKADASHRAAFDAVDRGWAVFDEAAGHEILTAMRDRAMTTRPNRRVSWAGLAMAASILLVVGGALFATRPWLGRAPAPGAAQTAFQYTSSPGEIREVRLPDGSIVTLDGDSAVSGHFSSKSRALELQRGRALFAVAPDRARPFAVTAGQREVVAVGTRFDVNLAAGTLTVTLLEGHVIVTPRDGASKAVRLTPGQRLVDRGDGASVASLATPQAAEAWRSGRVAFYDETLAEAAAMMNRYGGKRVLVRDPALTRLRVSGEFQAGEGERFAATLADLHDLEIIRRSENVELVRKR